ncbi:tyrosyl-DNA phosphodiesterase 1 [Mytilus galloprovincialis]|uniref:Tyrosyl-DNA phosphodiesterase 1 n=1 Tax=Mytilus galloprovincialis TaxID=29158 RepID=A0A8B6H6D7_MYTGA|nr:tyrosyl-DNA phosphodiesterase 1 [Mytilus galloprovincialis]
MSAKGGHHVSDTDSDITVGPEDSDVTTESPHKSPVKLPSLSKRRSEVHEISESEEESEEYFILKGTSKGKGKSSLFNSLKSTSEQNESKSLVKQSNKSSETLTKLKSQEKTTKSSSECFSKSLDNRTKPSSETLTKSIEKRSKPSSETLTKSIDKKTKLSPETLTKSHDKRTKPSSESVTKSSEKKTKSFTEIENWLDKIDSSPEAEKVDIKKRFHSPVEKGKHSDYKPSPSSGLKRKQTVLLEEEKKTVSRKKPPCQYGSKCYRKNPSHLQEFSHSDDNQQTSGSSRTTQESPPRKKPKISITGPRSPDQVYSEGQPYSFFLTKVHGIQNQYNQVLAMDIKDILSPIMGTLQASCQFNYMFEIPWLMKQYPEQFRSKPLLLVHGFTAGNKTALEIEATKYSNIKFCQARLEMIYGTHHTKMMMLLYEEGMRVVIHTSNLVERDWYQKTQGMWISPLFPKLKKEENKSNFSRGDSPTNFKKDLLDYIGSYKAYQLKDWQQNIADHDMSSAKVVIIGSSPGRHMAENKHKFGHMRLRKVLNTHGPPKDFVKSWPVIGQYSSIGSLGATKDAWLATEFLQSLATVEGSSCVPLASINLKLIFPTKDNVRCSLEGYPAGASIPYSINVAKKQTYLTSYFHHWISKGRGRSRAMPHIKSYCRPSPSSQEVAWFLVTSANLSKAAWGALEKKGSQLMIRSYELGVLFLPKFFGSKKTIPVSSDINDTDKLLLPYDLPLKPYQKEDRPWIWDIAYKELPDCNGNMWCPS